MKFFDKKSLIRYSPMLLVALILIVISLYPPLFKNLNIEKDKVSTTSSKDSPKEITIDSETSNNSVDINLNNSTQVNSQNNSTQGTCTVTKNGKTETVPADSVKINEKSSGDLNIKVDCDNTSSSSNQSSSSKTTIKNNVDIQVNSN